jgi:hypothetical protein
MTDPQIRQTVEDSIHLAPWGAGRQVVDGLLAGVSLRT